MKDRYLACYVSGRNDPYEGNVDTAMLDAKIDSGSPWRDSIVALARKTITDEMDAAAKVQWLKDNLDAIKSMGGDTEKAWRMFCDGRVEALALQLDEEAMEEVMNRLEEEDDEDEDDDEDEEDEGDEDSDDDEDDDEDEEDDDDDSE